MPLKRNVNRTLAKLTGYELTRARPAEAEPVPAPVTPPEKVELTPETDVMPGPAPVPRAEPGSRKLAMFFDEYPRFYETSTTSPTSSRLNARYDAIFEENKDILAGARVLDIASHDGRWSFAALQAGASHVIGIEAKDDLVAHANENLQFYGVPEDRYRFLCGDVHEVLASEPIEVDVVLCLGFLYHTLRYNELFKAIRNTNPKHLIIDTVIVPKRHQPLVKLYLDRSSWQRNAVRDAYSHGNRVLVGAPSAPALRMMLRGYGFKPERRSDWGAILRDNPWLEGVNDYAQGSRITVRASSKI